MDGGNSKIEKINSIFKSIRSGLSKSLDFIVKIKDIIWFVIVIIISIFLMSQCSSKNKLEREVDILTNISGTSQYKLTKALNGTYDIYSTDANGIITDTGVNITVNNNNPSVTINYYTLKVNNGGTGINKVSITTSNNTKFQNNTTISKVFRSGENIKIDADVINEFLWAGWTAVTGPEIITNPVDPHNPAVGFTINETREYTAIASVITTTKYKIEYYFQNPNNLSVYELVDTKFSNDPVNIGSTQTVYPAITSHYYYDYGWFETYPDGVTKDKNDTLPFAELKIQTTNACVKFFYDAKPCTLTYNFHNDDVNPMPITHRIFETINLLTPTYEGFEFTGWYKTIETNSYNGYSGYVGPSSFIITKDTILHATWTNDPEGIHIVANPIYGDIVPGYQFTVSATAINNTDNNITGTNPAKVTLKVYKENPDGTLTYVTGTPSPIDVVIPKNNKNLVYVNVTIPEDKVSKNDVLKFEWSISETP